MGTHDVTEIPEMIGRSVDAVEDETVLAPGEETGEELGFAGDVAVGGEEVGGEMGDGGVGQGVRGIGGGDDSAKAPVEAGKVGGGVGVGLLMVLEEGAALIAELVEVPGHVLLAEYH